MRNRVTLWFENANRRCQPMCTLHRVHVRVSAKQKNLMLIKVNAVWLCLIQFSMLTASDTHTHTHSEPIDEISVNAVQTAQYRNIQPSHCLYARSQYTVQFYIVAHSIGLLYRIRFDSTRFGCSACADVVVFVTHAHNFAAIVFM